MNFIRTSTYSAASTTVSLVVKLITNKIIAVYLGTNGMFLIGQLKDFLKIGNTLGTLGIETGTVKYSSELNTKEDEFKDLLSTSFKIHLYTSFIIIALVLLSYDYLKLYLTIEFSEMNDYLFKYILCFSIPVSYTHLTLPTTD